MLPAYLEHHLCFSTSRCNPEGPKVVVWENTVIGNKIRSIENTLVRQGDKQKVLWDGLG